MTSETTDCNGMARSSSSLGNNSTCTAKTCVGPIEAWQTTPCPPHTKVLESFQSVCFEFLYGVIFPHLQHEMQKSHESEARQISGAGAGARSARNSNCNTNLVTESFIPDTRFFVQSSPCIRFQPPSTQRLTVPHIDAMYGHQPSQVNFWLPLHEADGSVNGTNSLFSESFPGRGDFRSFDLNRGEAMHFYGNQCLHDSIPFHSIPPTYVSRPPYRVPIAFLTTEEQR